MGVPCALHASVAQREAMAKREHQRVVSELELAKQSDAEELRARTDCELRLIAASEETALAEHAYLEAKLEAEALMQAHEARAARVEVLAAEHEVTKMQERAEAADRFPTTHTAARRARFSCPADILLLARIARH